MRYAVAVIGAYAIALLYLEVRLMLRKRGGRR